MPDGGWVVTWTYEDADGNEDIYQQRFLPNKAPDQVSLSGAAVAEGAVSGTVAATLLGTDANLGSGDGLTYTLLDDAGGRFLLRGDKLVVADGLRLDFEQSQSHAVTVRATDKDGLSVERALIVQVGDVASENVSGSAAADLLVGGGGADIFRGLGGDDVLAGGGGKDVLVGGAGRDIFVFDTKPNTKTNLDRVVDFSVKDDSLYLDNLYFTKLGKGTPTKPIKLAKKAFWVGTRATTRTTASSMTRRRVCSSTIRMEPATRRRCRLRR